MKRLGLMALAALVLLASAASASVFYVKPANRTGSSDINSGADSTSNAVATIARGMALTQPGDTLRILGGTYASGIETVRPGTAIAYVYVRGDVVNPSNVTLTAGPISFRHSFVSIKGLRTTGPGQGVQFVSPWESPQVGSSPRMPRSDSLSWCWATPSDTIGDLSINPGGIIEPMSSGYRKSTNIVIYGCRLVLRGVWCDVMGGDGYCDPAGCTGDSSRTRYLTIRQNNITLLKGGSAAIWFFRGVQNSVVDSNIVRLIWQDPTNGATGWWKQYFASGMKWADNHFYIDDRRGGGGSYYVYQRDSSQANYYLRDTIDISTPRVLLNLLSNSGNTRTNGFEGRSRYERLLVRNPFGDGLVWQAGMNSDTLIRCAFATTGRPLTLTRGMRGNNVIDHCTFADSTSGAGWILGPGFDDWTGTFRLTSNIFYSKDTLGTNHTPLEVLVKTPLPLNSNNNIFTIWDKTGVDGDRSLSYVPITAAPDVAPVLTGVLQYSRPDSIPWRTVLLGNDLLSKYSAVTARAGLKFADSTITTFNPQLTAGSGALTVGEGGSDAGVHQFSAADAVRPDDPQDLYPPMLPGETSFVFEFLATGDDSLTGRAYRYDVRVSTVPMDGTNFETSPLFATGQVPALPGTIDRITVTGLTRGQPYWVAIKVIDEAENKSAISNVLIFTAGGASAIIQPWLGQDPIDPWNPPGSGQ